MPMRATVRWAAPRVAQAAVMAIATETVLAHVIPDVNTPATAHAKEVARIAVTEGAWATATEAAAVAPHATNTATGGYVPPLSITFLEPDAHSSKLGFRFEIF